MDLGGKSRRSRVSHSVSAQNDSKTAQSISAETGEYSSAWKPLRLHR